MGARIAAITYGTGLAGSAAWRAVQTCVQYRTWRADEVGSFLLPPHRSIAYFASYAWIHFWLPFVLSALASVGVWMAIRYGNARFQGKFFHAEEQFLAALGALIVGYAYVIPYVAIVLAAGLVKSSVRSLAGQTGRISLRMLWIPAALLLRVAFMFGV